MFRALEDFRKDWEAETKATLKLLQNLTDSSLSRKVTPAGRSLGKIAWHIVTTMAEMLNRTGLQIISIGEESKVPLSAKEIGQAYEKTAQSVTELIKQNWTDSMLTEEVEMYGEKWQRGYVLRVLLRHQTHHRGQMTVLMRQAGLKVPGLCGPSQEEWAQFGAPVPE